ncbi:MAG: hypothetical protein H0X27_03635 [Caulobacteraceae bacterium]|nr:hypothetical protein [Caulobacteraceae bacterium]
MKVIHWINSAGGDFDDGADWSGGAVPTARNRAVIDAPGTYTVTLSSRESVRSLALNAPGSTLLLEDGAMLSLGRGLTLKGGGLTLNFGATISGGTLLAKKGKFDWRGGTLDAVTYDGPLNLRHHRSDVHIGVDGIVLRGADGTGPGTVNISRNGFLHFDGSQTVDDATINISNSTVDFGSGTPDTTVTLGSQLAINHLGGISLIFGIKVTNDGYINAEAKSRKSELGIFTNEFTNSGVIVVSNGDFAKIQPTTFTNLVNGTLTGGSYEVDENSSLELNGNSAVTSDNAVITLAGPGSAMKSRTASSHEVSIESTLTTIGSGGTLSLLAGRDWTSTLAMTNSGTLVLGGGTFASAALTNDGLIRGRGVIAVAIIDDGTIKAVNGTLELTRSTSGAGALEVNPGGVLQVDAAAAASLTATFNGVGGNLKLGDAADFAATIAGFAAGDTIDLLGQAATSATLQAGDQLVVKNGSQTVATLQLSGDYTGDGFAVASDGHGGSNITVTAGLLAQAMASIAPAAAAQIGHSPETWRPHAAMLAGPRAMTA